MQFSQTRYAICRYCGSKYNIVYDDLEAKLQPKKLEKIVIENLYMKFILIKY